MALESKWWQWQKDKSVTLELKIGSIDFQEMKAEKLSRGGKERAVKIKRTENKKRQRPNGGNRHTNEQEEEDERN